LPLAKTCVVLAVAGFGASGPSAQPAVGSDPKLELAERIQQAQAAGGPYSTELIDPLAALSRLHQEEGQSALAVAAIEQALQVTRANYGLRSLEQVPLLRQRIRAEEERGNNAEAWELERELLTLAARHPEDLRTVPILHEIGDKRMSLLGRYLAGELPPEFTLGCYYAEPQQVTQDIADGWRNCDAGQRGVAVRNILLEAQRNYAHAIDVFLRQRVYSSDELHELEIKLLHNSYLYGGYDHGKQSLQRLIRYDVANGAPLTNRIGKLIELADWELLFDRRTTALEQYAQIYSLLERQGVSRPEIDGIFSPTSPVALPAFEPNPFARAENAGGYVDVAFDITRFGTTRRIDVESGSNAPAQAVDRISRWIVRSHFRPRITDGKAHDTRVAVRYYVRE
jgi:hypothetical protein